jgi:hypothetical protein
MSSKGRLFSCVYASGLTIPLADLATLAVFFDEIWLPYPYGVDPDSIGLPGFKDSGQVALGTFLLEGVRKEFRAGRRARRLCSTKVFCERCRRRSRPRVVGPLIFCMTFNAAWTHETVVLVLVRKPRRCLLVKSDTGISHSVSPP